MAIKNFSILYLMCVLLVQPSLAEEKEEISQSNTTQHCSSVFEDIKKCPNDLCALSCTEEMVIEKCECVPKPCYEIKAEHCPEDQCELLDGCAGAKVCFGPIRAAPDLCGDLSYEGQDVECCNGLLKLCGVEYFDGTCDRKGLYSIDSVPICIPCGNDICNQFENRCNCPEDCGEPND